MFFSFQNNLSSLRVFLGTYKARSNNFWSRYTLCLISIPLNYNIIEIEKTDGVCSSSYIVDKFSGLYFHPSIFFIKYTRQA